MTQHDAVWVRLVRIIVPAVAAVLFVDDVLGLKSGTMHWALIFSSILVFRWLISLAGTATTRLIQRHR